MVTRNFIPQINVPDFETGNDGVLMGQGVMASGPVIWVPRNYTEGLAITKGTDATNDILTAVGDCADSTNEYILKQVRTGGSAKQIDAPWTTGGNAGGMFTGSVANSTQYYFHLIRRDADGYIDMGFDTSATAANIPTGYTAYRQIGRVYRNASGVNTNIVYNLDAITETGEWTPTLQDSSQSDAEGQSYTFQNGVFIKTTVEVSFAGDVDVDGLGTLTTGDSARIAGLPYTPGAAVGVVSVGQGTGLAITAGTNVSGTITAGATRISLYLWDSTIGVTALTIGEVSSTGRLIFSGQYFL